MLEDCSTLYESPEASFVGSAGRVACPVLLSIEVATSTTLGASGTCVRGTEDERLGEPDGVVRPSGTCRRLATLWACAACPVDILFSTSGRRSAHICNALIEPHSMILLLSH